METTDCLPDIHTPYFGNNILRNAKNIFFFSELLLTKSMFNNNKTPFIIAYFPIFFIRRTNTIYFLYRFFFRVVNNHIVLYCGWSLFYITCYIIQSPARVLSKQLSFNCILPDYRGVCTGLFISYCRGIESSADSITHFLQTNDIFYPIVLYISGLCANVYFKIFYFNTI